MRFVLFWGNVSSYNHFSWSISNELKNMGHEVFIWNLDENKSYRGYSLEHLYESEMNNNNSISNLISFAMKGVDYFISYSGIGLKEIKLILPDLTISTPIVNIFVDHPLHFKDVLDNSKKNDYILCVDHNHVSYIKKYYSDIKNVYFLSHAGTIPQEKFISFSNKKYDLMFCGTYRDPNILFNNVKEMCLGNLFLQKTFENIYEVLLSEDSTDLTIEDAIKFVINCPEEEIFERTKNLSFGCSYIDWAIRMIYRYKVINTINRKNIPIVLSGGGWDSFPFYSNKNVTILTKRILYQEMLPIMMQGKVQLNIFPWFKNGSHERIWNTMLRNSVVLTDENIWTKEKFESGRDLITYKLQNIDFLPDIVGNYLNDKEKLSDIAEHGMLIAKKYGTWNYLVNNLLEILNYNI